MWPGFGDTGLSDWREVRLSQWCVELGLLYKESIWILNKCKYLCFFVSYIGSYFFFFFFFSPQRLEFFALVQARQFIYVIKPLGKIVL
jgi:hypothetical protein